MTDLSTLSDRDLNARVAAALGIVWPDGRCRVCGWTLDPDEKMCRLTSEGDPDCSLRPLPETRRDEPAAYSTDGNAMLLLLRELREWGHWQTFAGEAHGGWSVLMIGQGLGVKDVDVTAPTLPRAVAEAAVLALEEA